MGPRQLPVLSRREVMAAFRKAGFELDRVRGSHHMMRYAGPPVRGISIPIHGNKQLPRGTLKAIVEESGLTVEAFVKLL